MTDCHITVQRGGTHGAQRHIFQSAAGQAGKTPGGGAGRICPGPLCPGLGQPDHPWGGDSRGSFYMYFADKEELFRYLMEDFGTQLIRQMERLLEERNGAVFAAFLDLFDYVQDRRAEYRDLLNILRRNGDMRPGLFPGRMPGGPARRACGSGWTSRGWTCGRRRPGSHPPPALFPHRRRPDALGRTGGPERPGRTGPPDGHTPQGRGKAGRPACRKRGRSYLK